MFVIYTKVVAAKKANRLISQLKQTVEMNACLLQRAYFFQATGIWQGVIKQGLMFASAKHKGF